MCSSNCPQGNHETWGECVRGKSLRIAYCRSSVNVRNDFTASKKWDKELDAYASVRKEGIQPDSTQMPDIMKAREFSDKTGVAYGAWGS